MAKKKVVAESTVSNDAKEFIEMTSPYVATVKIRGSSDMLFHRWSCEGVAEKSAAAKGSKTKKTDDLESYIYRLDNGNIALPGEYLRQSIIHAAKFRQDPRSPRKSAMDLYKAGIISLTILADLGEETWDYEDKRRVVIQRSGITRTRPAMKEGWECSFDLMVNIPEYINPTDLNDVVSNAGRLIGLGDFRPTFGRFQITEFKVNEG